jgi:hypothetical protein
MASGCVPFGVFLALPSCNQEVIPGFSGELLRWETAEVAGEKRSRLNKPVRPPDLVDLCRVRHRRHLLHPLPQVRGRFVGSDGGPIYMLWCWRALRCRPRVICWEPPLTSSAGLGGEGEGYGVAGNVFSWGWFSGSAGDLALMVYRCIGLLALPVPASWLAGSASACIY